MEKEKSENVRPLQEWLKHKWHGHRCGVLILLSCFFIIVCVGCSYIFDIRLDQYMSSICGTTAAVVSTMFGLSAASYAFVRNDMRKEENIKPYLTKTLAKYHQRLWHTFIFSLVLTIATVLSSFLILGLAQEITSSNLFVLQQTDAYTAAYNNPSYKGISVCVAFNLSFALLAVVAMAVMNNFIFRREKRYENIAEEMLTVISNKYKHKIIDDSSGYDEYQRRKITEHYKTLAEELEKIHIIERLIDRILTNHQCIGEAFAAHQRRDSLFSVIITRSLQSNYYVGLEEDNFNHEPDTWGLAAEKGGKRWEVCVSIAKKNFDALRPDKKLEIVKPDEQSMVVLYDDLLTYRDCKLICKENRDIKRKYGHLFLKSLKRRSLLFLMRGEDFGNMDLSRIKFSGADLRFVNFSNSNLTRAKLCGANCESADFTNARMPGMFFRDEPGSCHGEIEITCHDDGITDNWDPYWSREATRLVDVTFTGADVSRAQLLAPGELAGDVLFPFANNPKSNTLKLISGSFFSLTGTNFDHAKLFSSCLKNIDLDNSSLEQAQMFNTVLIQCVATNTNFYGALLTNSCLLWCDFAYANFQGAVLTNSAMARLNFHGARLQKANFSNCNIVACNFSGAYCQDVSFKNMIQGWERLVDLPGLKNEGIDKVIKHELNFSYATLSNTDFSGASLADADFSHAIGTNCVLSNASANHAHFNNALFNSSLFNSSEFKDCFFEYAFLRDSVFLNTCFQGGKFIEADFSHSLFSCEQGPCFSELSMTRVNLKGTQGLTESGFKDVKFIDMDFTGTGLDKAALEAYGNKLNDHCIFESEEK